MTEPDTFDWRSEYDALGAAVRSRIEEKYLKRATLEGIFGDVEDAAQFRRRIQLVLSAVLIFEKQDTREEMPARSLPRPSAAALGVLADAVESVLPDVELS